MRREYIEDVVLVIGGAAIIAGTWIVYEPLGLIAAGLFALLLARVAYRHRAKGNEHAARNVPEKIHEPMPAAAWRFHGHVAQTHGSQRNSKGLKST